MVISKIAFEFPIRWRLRVDGQYCLGLALCRLYHAILPAPCGWAGGLLLEHSMRRGKCVL